MIPVFSVISSKSNVGKTTALCHIIRELKSRGYKVATIKHHGYDFDIDHPGKDTWMHANAGADIVAISSPNKIAIIEKVEKEYTLDEVISKIENVDIIITEGYKWENKPKVEVFRKEISKEVFSKAQELIAMITDTYIENDIPQFNFSEIKKLVDFIESKFLKNTKNKAIIN
jgi:molybdopterin-guanine dinucleotide biosynthesis protein B